MSQELRESVEARITNTLENITIEVFSNRIGIVSFYRMCNNIDFGDDVSNANRSDVCVSCCGDAARTDSPLRRNRE